MVGRRISSVAFSGGSHVGKKAREEREKEKRSVEISAGKKPSVR